MSDLHVQLAPKHSRGLLLKNPVMTASGTFGYGDEYRDLVDIQSLGAIVCKGTTLEPWEGNPQPRLIETDYGLLNSVGLQNIGVQAVIEEKAPIWTAWHVPVIVNIAGKTIDEYRSVATRLEGVGGIGGLELNISCPNLACGGLEFGVDPQAAAEVTAAVKAVSSLPVIVKLSPNVTDIGEIAVAVSKAGADAITLINTVRGTVIDIECGKPALGNVFGGLSGPAIKPIALAMVYKVAKIIDIPIIGCGGIGCGEDALEFIMAGATAIQVGSAHLSNPRASIDVLNGISEFMKARKIQSIQEIRGMALNS